MDVEILEVQDFLAEVRPFDALDGGTRAALARDITIRYVRRGDVVLEVGAENHHLYIIRSGAVRLSEMGEAFAADLGEAACFAYPSLLRDNRIRNQATALEDCLLYLLPDTRVHALIAAHPVVQGFFSTQEADRLRSALSSAGSASITAAGGQVLARPLKSMIRRVEIITAPTDLSIRAVAGIMRDKDVSTMLLMEGDALAGILTDKDLRRRVVADGLDYEAPASYAMTPSPLTLRPDARAIDALLLMTRRNIHHIPVVDAAGQPVGMVSASDILAQMSAHPLQLNARIDQAADPDEIARYVRQLPASLVALVEAGLSAQDCCHFATLVGEAATRRLLALAEDKLGPPPGPYCWLAFGSMARDEQAAVSDQDNGLLLADSVSEDDRNGYFRDLAHYVSDGLDQAGYSYCKGEIMATTHTWRQPLGVWQKTFSKWIIEPEPKALMHANIFFDLRGIHGDMEMAEALRGHILEHTKGQTLFLAHLTANARAFTPPLGFFRNFVLEKDTDHKDRLDLKKRGVVPVVELARILTLANGVPQVGTVPRLQAAQESQALDGQSARDLLDAYAFVSIVRLRHQARQISAGEAPDNYVDPKMLSRFDRDHLKDAFGIIRRQMQVMEKRFHAERL